MVAVFLQQVGENENRWMELLSAADRIITSCPPGGQEQLEQERDYLFTNNFAGMRGMRTRIQRSVRAERTQSYQKSFLKGLQIDQFTGGLENWVAFQQTFQQLTADQGMSDSVLLAHLRRCLAPCPEALNLIMGITVPKEAWKELEARFGDRDLALVTVRHELLNLSVSGKPGHEQVEALRNAVRKAQAQLKSLGASSVFGDTTLVGRLVHKLSSQHQWDWHRHSTAQPYRQDTREQGEKFIEWLEEMGQAAKSARLTEVSAALTDGGTRHVCSVCARPGHKAEDCEGRPTPTLQSDPVLGNGFMAEAQLDRQSEAAVRKRCELKRTTTGSCPLCKQHHTYLKKYKWGSLEWPSHRLSGCPTFEGLTPPERAQRLEDEGGCGVCTAWTHPRSRCRTTNLPNCQEIVKGGGPCGQRHHRLFHGCKNPFVMAHTVGGELPDPVPDLPPHSDPGLEPGAMLLDGTRRALHEFVQADAVSSDGPVVRVTVFGDQGSNVNFIRRATAERLKLKRSTVNIYLKVINEEYREREMDTYKLGIRDRHGVTHNIEAIGVDSITNVRPLANPEAARQAFPDAPEEVFNRPVGPADILLSMTERHLLCDFYSREGMLYLNKTLLGCGYVLTGMAPCPAADRSLPSPLSAECMALKAASHQMPLTGSVFHVAAAPGAESFLDLQELTTNPPPLCQSCKGCPTCRHRRVHMSEKEQETLDRVEKSMTLKDGRLQVEYPFKPCVEKLRNNYRQVEKTQSRIEARSIRDGTYGAVQEEMLRAEKAGAIRKLRQEEMDGYDGPVNYNSYFPVKNESSVSSKIRVVLNSAQINATCGLSLNMCTEKGPDTLQPMLDILIRWRTVEHALHGDLSKAYQNIQTGEKEMHVRRILWRASPDQRWLTYAYQVVTFGDIAAALILESAKRKAAELGEAIDPEAARQIRENMFVDDAAMGGDLETVRRMRGGGEGARGGTVEQILNACGLSVKFLAASGDQSPDLAAPLGGKVLGLAYDLAADQMSFTMEAKFRTNSGNRQKTNVNLTAAQIREIRQGTRTFTHRMALSFVMGVFDPLGMIAPALLEGKTLLRRLYGGGSPPNWDTNLPAEEREAWSTWMESLRAEAPITMPRSVHPGLAAGRPTICGFADASRIAMCASVYVVWDSETGTTSNLLLGKVRVAPMAGYSIPRSELNALVILARLLSVTVRAAAFTPARIVAATDSACCLAAMKKPGASLHPFFANRVGEIRQTWKELAEKVAEVEEISYIPSKHNPADIGTRPGVRLSELAAGSRWQHGEPWMLRPRAEWPLQGSVPGTIPQSELRGPSAEAMMAEAGAAPRRAADSSEERAEQGEAPARPGGPTTAGVWNLLVYARRSTNPKFASTWERSVGTLARLLQALSSGRPPGRTVAAPSAPQRARARWLQFLSAAPSARTALQAGQLRSLGAYQRRGLVIVSGRIHGDDLARLLGKPELPVLMPTESLALLITREAHQEDHRRSPQDVVARTRKHCWIVRGTALARTVISRCATCRLNDHKLSKQIMSLLPPEKLSRAPPMAYCSLDMFGPWTVKDMAKGRRTWKAWGTLFTCLVTGATWILATAGYSTAGFMITYRKFCCTYKPPLKVFCDHGSQIVCGTSSPDWREIREAAALEGTDFVYTPVGCHHRNSQAERHIQSARRTLEVLLPKHAPLMDFNELDCAFLQVSHILNSRPLAIRTSQQGNYHSLTPNDLLLGRASRDPNSYDEPPDGEEVDQAVADTMDAVSNLVQAWWEAWMTRHFPELCPRRKWHQQFRNLAEGDICQVRYASGYGTPTYRLCRITRTHPDSKGIVRTVTVSFRPRRRGETCLPTYRHKPLTELRLAIQRLCVVLPAEEQTAQQEEPHGGQEQQEEPHGGQEQQEEPHGGLEQQEEPHGGLEQQEEHQGALEQQEETHGGLEQQEEPHGGQEQQETGPRGRPYRACKK
jgi:hypothetical protein